LERDNLTIDVLNLMPKRGDYQFLDVRSRDAGDAAGFVLAVLQHRLRDVVAIAHALLVGVARAHQVTAIIEEKTREEGRRARQSQLAGDRSMLEFRLHGLEQLPRDRRATTTARLVVTSQCCDSLRQRTFTRRSGRRARSPAGLQKRDEWTETNPKIPTTSVIMPKIAWTDFNCCLELCP
jgi:hypothetical protein